MSFERRLAGARHGRSRLALILAVVRYMGVSVHTSRSGLIRRGYSIHLASGSWGSTDVGNK